MIFQTIGMRNEESGYESMVIASRAVFQSFDLIEQRRVMMSVLQKAIPRLIVSMASFSSM